MNAMHNIERYKINNEEKEKQEALFENPKQWEDEWKDMPKFKQEKQEPYHKLIVRFSNEEDLKEFASLIGQNLNNKTQSIWHPKLIFADHINWRYVDEGANDGK